MNIVRYIIKTLFIRTLLEHNFSFETRGTIVRTIRSTSSNNIVKRIGTPLKLYCN